MTTLWLGAKVLRQALVSPNGYGAMNGIAESNVHLSDNQRASARKPLSPRLLARPHSIGIGGLNSEDRAVIKGDRKHGRSRDAPEGHSPVDVASEGQAADSGTGIGVFQEGGRTERTSGQPA